MTLARRLRSLLSPRRARRSDEETARLFARVFRGADGEAALDHLITLTLARSAGPDIDPHALAHLEGQRFLARTIATLIERGRQ